MKGLSELVSLIMLVSITVTILSIVFFYFQTNIMRASSEVEEIGLTGNCHQKASIEIINFNGKNLTVRNNGAIILDLKSFNIYSIYKKIEFSYNDADNLLKPDEKVVFVLTNYLDLGPLRVTGECSVGDEIDTRYTYSINYCGDVNCDGRVNNIDIGDILNYVTYHTPICNEWAADVNCNGDINMGDIILLLNNKVYGYPLKCC